MSASVETLEGLERRITLNLNSAEIESEVDKRLKSMSRNVKMDGFRPGKAPFKVVAMRYGSEVRGEVLSDALQKAFFGAVRSNQLDVAGYPRFEPAGEGAFNATFEVFPEIVIGDLGQIKVTRPVVSVSEADVERTLNVLRKQRLRYVAVDRPAENGDRVHVDYTGKIDGEVFKGGEAKDFPVVLGEGRTLPDFEGSLMGMKAGESKVFDVSFPEDYFAKELAGKTATFEAILNSIDAPVLPELDEAFASYLGIKEGGTEKLLEEVAANLEREARRRVQARVKEQVVAGLMAVSPFEVPKGLVAEEAKSLMERAIADLKARGMKEQDIKLSLPTFEPQARHRVAAGLLLTQFAAVNKLTADEDKVRAKVEEFAQSYEDPSEVVAWYYQDATRLRDARASALEDAVVSFVLQSADVTDEQTSLENLLGKV